MKSKQVHVLNVIQSFLSRRECHSQLKTTMTWEIIFTLTITWLFMNSEKVPVMNVIQSWRLLKLESEKVHVFTFPSLHTAHIVRLFLNTLSMSGTFLNSQSSTWSCNCSTSGPGFDSTQLLNSRMATTIPQMKHMMKTSPPQAWLTTKWQAVACQTPDGATGVNRPEGNCFIKFKTFWE